MNGLNKNTGVLPSAFLLGQFFRNAHLTVMSNSASCAPEPLDWDSQSLYMAAILENGGPNRGTESKTCKKK